MNGIVFSLIYTQFTLFNETKVYLKDPVAIISLVTALVVMTTVMNTMLLGRRIVKHTTDALELSSSAPNL